jgi:hypothetical protein
MTSKTEFELNQNLAAQRKISGQLHTHNDQRIGTQSELDAATAAVAEAQVTFSVDPTDAHRAALDSARETANKIAARLSLHDRTAPDLTALNADIHALSGQEKLLRYRLTNERMDTLKAEYPEMWSALAELLPTFIAAGYHIQGINPGNADPWKHLCIVNQTLMPNIDAAYARIKAQLEGE